MAKPKVILFDVNETLLDLSALKGSVGQALGGHPELMPLWFTTMLQYSLVTTVAGRYSDFGEIGTACLRMVAKSHGVTLDEDAAKEAVSPIRSLPPHRGRGPSPRRASKGAVQTSHADQLLKRCDRRADEELRAGEILRERIERRRRWLLQTACPCLPLGGSSRRG